MAWSTADDVVRLIEGMMSPDDQRRSTADAQLRALRESSINYGDVLADVVVRSPSASLNVRLAAAMQLEGMTCKAQWIEGSSFSDKPLVTSALLALLGEPQYVDATDAVVRRQVERVREVVHRSVGNICAAEFHITAASLVATSVPLSPSSQDVAAVDSPWVQQLHDMVGVSLAEGSAANNLSWAASCQRCLLHAATLGRQNPALWKFLAGPCTERCHAALFAPSPAAALITERNDVTTFVVRFVSALASKPPVDSQIFETFLFCGTFMSTMLQLQRYVRLEDMWSMPSDEDVASGCDIKIQLLTYMIHAPKREVVHRPVLEDTLATLTSIGQSYLQVALGSNSGSSKRAEALIAVITEMLEAVQAIMDMLPASYDWVSATTLFEAFLWFMVSDDDANWSGADGVGDSDALLSLLESEEVTLAGCGSGSPRAVASSLIQLFIERDQDSLIDFVQSWSGFAAQVGVTGPDMYWAALVSMLTAMAHECRGTSTSLFDFVAGCETLVLQPLTEKLVHQSSETSTSQIRARIVYSIGCCLNLSTNTTVCGQAVTFLIDLIEGEARRSSAPTPTACVALHAVAGIITASTEVASALTETLPSSLMECALWVASAGDLGAYCGGYAVSVLLDIGSAAWIDSLWLCGRLPAASGSVVRHCSTATKGRVLTSLIKALVESHFDNTAKRCVELQRFFEVVHDVAVNNSLLSSIVVRSLFESLPAMLQDPRAEAGCSCSGAVNVLAADVCAYATHDGPHDDATLRALSVCVGWFIGCGVAPHMTESAALSLFGACTASPHACQSQTLSNASLCLALTAARAPAAFLTRDGLWSFTAAVMSQKRSLKDMNVTGASLFPALCSTFHPELLIACVASGDDRAAAVAEYIGMWASTIAFADRRTQLYTLIGWYRVLQLLAAQQPANVSEPSHVLQLFCAPQTTTFRKLKSLHDKQDPRSLYPCSILQAVVFGLSDLCYTKLFTKLTNFTLHCRFDDLLSPNRQTSIVSDTFCVEILNCTSSEAALKILNLVAGSNFPEASHMVQAATNAMLQAAGGRK